MPSQISDHRFAHAILESVQNGKYPESEEVISAELPPSAIPTVLKLIDQAREDVKKTLRKESQESASDIDGWIFQAKLLRADIEESQRSSHDIESKSKYREELRSQVHNATGKLGLLEREATFNETLATTLERFRGIRQSLRIVENAILHERFTDAVGLLLSTEIDLESLPTGHNTKVTRLLQAGVAELRSGIVESLTQCWGAFFFVDLARSSISARQEIQRSTLVEASAVIDAFTRLNLLEMQISSLRQDIEDVILKPRLTIHGEGVVQSLEVEDNEIRICGALTDLSIRRLSTDMHLFVEFLYTQLPSSISLPLSKSLMPSLISQLISKWLSVAVPIDVERITEFKDDLILVVRFAEVLDFYGWPGKDLLTEWINGIPQVWLSKRREILMNKVRILLAGGAGKTEEVERTETQMLPHHADDNDWNAGWSDEEGGDTGKSPQPSDAKTAEREGEEEEDVSAWGLDDEANNEVLNEGSESLDNDNEDARAWGWGEENEDTEDTKPERVDHAGRKKSAINGHLDTLNSREITLRETYKITALPKEILEIIMQLIGDAAMLKTPAYIDSPIVSAAGELLSLPGLVLSMYRACAPDYYASILGGSMFLYNDILWLAENLRQRTGTLPKRTGQAKLGFADIEISSMESFARRIYGKEMESQRTIIGDLLDGAQGFVNCTEPPFSQECDVAISSTIKRLRDVHKEWSTILSHSALLQSIGSLLSTIAKKVIVDIEDMSDISEPESQRLAAFCNSIASVEDLFTPPESVITTPEDHSIPLTAVYTPNWLKFQYLANILESSLVDIKFLWIEGELRLEFDVEELVDLIEALFADSEHRRRAIAEIRRV